MFCAKCGVQNDDNLNFCANCGAPLKEAAPVVTETPAEPGQPVYQAPVAPQQPVYQAPPVPVSPVYPAPAAPIVPGKGLGITGMVLGIISLVFFCVFYIGLPCAIIGLVLSIVSASKAKSVGQKNGMATAGIICSAISIGLGLIVILLGVIGIIGSVGMGSSYF